MNRERDLPIQRATVTLTDRLEEARGLGVQGYYESAIEIIDGLLKDSPMEMECLRLKGNLLELRAMEVAEINRKKLTTSADYLTARQCYEKILEINPGDVKAHIDLGDHYRNLEANDKALDFYKVAASALQKEPRRTSWREDVEQVLDGVVLLKKHARQAVEASSLEAWCTQALGAADP